MSSVVDAEPRASSEHLRPAPEPLRTLTSVRQERWGAHPYLAALVRTAVVAVPVGAGAVAGIVAFRAVGSGLGVPGWVLAFAVSTGVVVGVDRFARRWLPLAVLLRISLVFPDRAPSRLHVAMRTGSLRRLRSWADEVGPGLEHDAAAAAEAVLTLAAALNVHDRRTRGHSERVRALTDVVAEELGLEAADADRLRWGALLHDIGKLAVPAAILNKPGKPDEDEWVVLRGHPAEGVRLSGALGDWLGEWVHAIDQHHERWDGGGYPDGLRGDDITLAGRIVAVTDAFETMTEVRAYKKAMSFAEARRELVRCSGTQFDPTVVRAFQRVSIGRLHWAMGPLSWLVQLPFLGAVPRTASQASSIASSQAANGAVALASVSAVVLSGLVVADAPHGPREEPIAVERAPSDRERPAAPDRPAPASVDAMARAGAPTAIERPAQRSDGGDPDVAVASPAADSGTEEPARPNGAAPSVADAPAAPDPGAPTGPTGAGHHGPGSPAGVLDGVTDRLPGDAARDAVDRAKDAVGGLVDGAKDAVKEPVGEIVDGAKGAVGSTVGDLVDRVTGDQAGPPGAVRDEVLDQIPLGGGRGGSRR